MLGSRSRESRKPTFQKPTPGAENGREEVSKGIDDLSLLLRRAPRRERGASAGGPGPTRGPVLRALPVALRPRADQGGGTPGSLGRLALPDPPDPEPPAGASSGPSARLVLRRGHPHRVYRRIAPGMTPERCQARNGALGTSTPCSLRKKYGTHARTPNAIRAVPRRSLAWRVSDGVPRRTSVPPGTTSARCARRAHPTWGAEPARNRIPHTGHTATPKNTSTLPRRTMTDRNCTGGGAPGEGLSPRSRLRRRGGDRRAARSASREPRSARRSRCTPRRWAPCRYGA
jgi:hypothetical protein